MRTREIYGADCDTFGVLIHGYRIGNPCWVSRLLDVDLAQLIAGSEDAAGH